MGKEIDEIISALPEVRGEKINRKAKKMAGEMIAYADSLGMIRKAVGKTQAEVGKGLGMPQNAISQLESRGNMRLSTLVRYVDAIGGHLDLVIRMKDGSQVVLDAAGAAKPRKATQARGRISK